jgi:sphinganine-1-phosphate aldolase
MSVDTHKYGYALKGTSVVLYANPELRHAQYFNVPDWTGGMYSTPTIAGSRSTGMIAQTWASMVAMGEEGYMKNAKKILDCCKYIADGVNKIHGLEVMGYAEVMIVCFQGNVPGLNIYRVADKMTKKGWSLNSMQNPPCVNICCTGCHVGHEDELLADLRLAAEEVLADPGSANEGRAAMYGMAASLPPGPINAIMDVYNDVCYKL